MFLTRSRNNARGILVLHMSIRSAQISSSSINEHRVLARAFSALRLFQIAVVQGIHRPQVVWQQAATADASIALPYLDALHILPDLATLANEDACRDKVRGRSIEVPYPRKVDSRADGASAHGGPHVLTVGDGGSDSVSNV